MMWLLCNCDSADLRYTILTKHQQAHRSVLVILPDAPFAGPSLTSRCDASIDRQDDARDKIRVGKV